VIPGSWARLAATRYQLMLFGRSQRDDFLVGLYAAG
jgi:hypothetical protein